MFMVCAVVGVAPQFTEKLHSQRVREGGPARFAARVSGNPPPEVTWYREGLMIGSSPDFVISSHDDLHSLTIREVFREDAGKFSARASNPLGQVHCVAELIVERTSLCFIIYLLITPKQPNIQTYKHTKHDKSNKHKIQHWKHEKTFTAYAANVFHTDFLIKDTVLSYLIDKCHILPQLTEYHTGKVWQ